MTQIIRGKLSENIKRVLVGKSLQADLLLNALLCGGHALIEDVPGTGKTSLVKAFAQSIGCSFHRVQFTPDLMPSDITGINYFNVKLSDFQFIPGPVFANIVLADEINRATPKTQSGLLECMEERQATIDGTTHALPLPFMVIATQNPVESQGVFALPEAQLDRFFLKIPMGINTDEQDFEILRMHNAGNSMQSITPVVAPEDIYAAQAQVQAVSVHDDIMKYIVTLCRMTHSDSNVLLGVSPRGCIALLKAAKCAAAIAGRGYVIPDDVKAMARYILPHRLIIKRVYELAEDIAQDITNRILEKCPVPTENFSKYRG